MKEIDKLTNLIECLQKRLDKPGLGWRDCAMLEETIEYLSLRLEKKLTKRCQFTAIDNGCRYQR